MVKVYVNLIINNRRKLSDVPSLIHDQVKELLLEMNLTELTE